MRSQAPGRKEGGRAPCSIGLLMLRCQVTSCAVEELVPGRDSMASTLGTTVAGAGAHVGLCWFLPWLWGFSLYGYCVQVWTVCPRLVTPWRVCRGQCLHLGKQEGLVTQHYQCFLTVPRKEWQE
jgi:hypothetical protein